MKRILCIALLCLVFALEAALAEFEFMPIEPTELTGYAVNCSEYISLRSSPSTGASALARIPLGGRFAVTSHEVFGGSDHFVQVRYNGTTGYVLIEYMDIDTSTFSSSQRRRGEAGTVSAKEATDDLLIRSGAGTGYAILGYLYGGEALASDGTMVTDAKGNRWYACTYQGMKAYIIAKYAQYTVGASSQSSAASSGSATLPAGLEFGMRGSAWYTFIDFAANNAFSGNYHHREESVNFSGSFTDVRMVDSTIYSMRTGAFTADVSDSASIMMGLTGLGDQWYLYGPGTPKSKLPSDASWFSIIEDDYDALPDVLDYYVLYNATEGYCYK